MTKQAAFLFDGDTLSLEKLVQLSSGTTPCDLSRAAWDKVAEGRRIVVRSVADGSAYYGVNTGVGSQKDADVQAADFAAFNEHVIVAEATNMPGSAFAPEVVRGALAVMLNNAATGRLGLRPELVRRMLRLFHSADMPEVRSGTSSGMADLGPLAQLALPLVGRSLDGCAPLIEGPYDLAEKEAVSLINCNAFALSHGAHVMAEAARLAIAFDLAAALSLEAFRGNLSYYRAEMQPGYRNPHQLASCRQINHALRGARLWQDGEARFLQDPLSFRFAMRVGGTVRSALTQATAIYEDDLNCVCDNPVVSLETASLVTGINMDSTPLTYATDGLRQAIAMAAAVSTERSLKVQHAGFSGLPLGLAQPRRADGGVQNLIISYLGVARQAELRGLAAPVLLDCAHALADGIEDVSGLGPLSVARTEQAVALAWQVVTVEMIIASWALALRGLEISDMGQTTGAIYTKLRPFLPIGSEGREVLDMSGPIDCVSAPEFVQLYRI